MKRLISVQKPLLINRGILNGIEANKQPQWKLSFILLILLSLILCTGFTLFTDFFEFELYSPKTNITYNLQIVKGEIPNGFYIHTKGCRIPYMDPWDESIRQFIEKGKTLICNKNIPALFDYTHTGIKIVNSSLKLYKIDNLNELECCFQEMIRINSKVDENDNKVKFTDCTNFNESLEVDREFIMVVCRYQDREIYKDLFSFVPVKHKKQPLPHKLNVLIIGIDAVSRLNFHRQMPKTVNFLLNNLSAVELFGYNKVADNTFPNLMPVLTGHTEEELKESCLLENEKFDNCSFVWKNYSTEGYLTSFTEDASWMGLFNYLRKGFIVQPTDYNWAIFNRISEEEIGNSHNLNVYECVGARPVYRTLLDYTYRFISTMAKHKLPYFNLVWSSSLSHDYLNQPSIGDEAYLELLEKFINEGYLNNTVLIMMSDHGIRWGDIRQTYQGRMEERLPFLFFILPGWFKENNQQAYYNLLKNSRRLTTPFDLHETLKALIHPYNMKMTNKGELKRGYNLFSDIPLERTCKAAGISNHWCTCQQSLDVDKDNNIIVKESAHFAVQHLNKQLLGFSQCVRLKLKEILNVRLMFHTNDIVENGDKGKDYMITLKTEPGDAVFEVTVRVEETKNQNRSYNFEVMGTISRLNLYGKQSNCVNDVHLKLYCYCV